MELIPVKEQQQRWAAPARRKRQTLAGGFNLLYFITHSTFRQPGLSLLYLPSGNHSSI